MMSDCRQPEHTKKYETSMDSLQKYIESLTKTDSSQGLENVKQSSVLTNQNFSQFYKNNLPYNLKIEEGCHNQFNMENFEDTEFVGNEDQRFADIKSSIREMGLGMNVHNALNKRYIASQQRNVEQDINECDSESDLSYTTVSSMSNESYFTAIEDIQLWMSTSEEIKSDVSISSSIDKDRYKKNALITGLLSQSTESVLSDTEVNNVKFFETSAEQLHTSNLTNEIQNEQENPNADNNKKKLNNDASEREMYEDRVCRLFQSQEDEDVYVHPLREQIQKDPEWQEHRLSRKGIEYTETARMYYFSLPDENFNIFERVEEKKTPKPEKKARKYMSGF